MLALLPPQAGGWLPLGGAARYCPRAPHGLAGHRVAHAILHTNLDRLPVAVRDGVRSEKVSCRILVVSCSW